MKIMLVGKFPFETTKISKKVVVIKAIRTSMGFCLDFVEIALTPPPSHCETLIVLHSDHY